MTQEAQTMPEHANPQLQIAICDDESIDRQQAADLTREIMEGASIVSSSSPPDTFLSIA